MWRIVLWLHIIVVILAGAATVRSPLLWSREEAFLKTGHWSGTTSQAWEPTVHGGNDVHRPLQSYAADRYHFGAQVII